MGILEGKTLLVTGVLTDASIAYHVAKLSQEQGATVVLTSFGRAMSLTKRIAGRLPAEAPVLELDVTDPEHLATLADRIREHVPQVDGVLHSIGFAPAAALGGNFLNTEWDDVATAVHVSAYSLKALTMATLPLMVGEGRTSSVVGLTFDATVAWPKYDWMGVAKAALESTSRYLARDLGPQGVRVNLVAAGPIGSVAAKSIPGFEEFKHLWDSRAAVGWDLEDPEPAARACVALFSDWFPKTTAEMIHVDGGVHAIEGAPHIV
ncbi:MAG: enoyl-ACP reductase FabI [Candidatus Nanopelagicales bacterium]